MGSSDDSDSMVSMVSNPSLLRKTFRSMSKSAGRQRKESMTGSRIKNEIGEVFKSVKNYDSDLSELKMISADSKSDKYWEYFMEWNKKEYI